MAMSPLTASLLGGGMGGGGMYGPMGMAMYDPAALGAMQRLQLGQGMLQEGMSAAPAYPMQAISRLGQSLIGAMMLKRGFGDLSGLQQAHAGDATSMMNQIEGMGAPAASPAPAAAAPTAPTAGAEGPFPGGGQPPSPNAAMAPLIAQSAQANGIPPQLATALLQQESSMGTAAPNNVGQITFKTANNPGYGMTPLAGNDLKDPQKNIDFSMQYLRKAGDAAGVKDWNDPSQWGLALHAYNGGGDPNYIQHVARFLPQGTQVGPGPVQTAQAGNVMTDATAGPASAPQAAAPQGPQVGMNNPHISQQMQQIKAYELLASQHPLPIDPIGNMARGMVEFHKQQLNVGAWVSRPDGTMVNTVSGETKYGGPPTPRLGTDVHGNTLMVSGGAPPQVIAPNLSGISGNTPEANAMRTLAELKPGLDAGTLTPQQIANYNVAAEVFQQPKAMPLPGTNQIASVPGRPMPGGGFPPVAGETGSPAGGNANASGPHVTPLTAGVAPTESINERYKTLDQLRTASQAGQDELQQAALLKDTMTRLGATGPATPFLANISRYAAQMGVPQQTLDKFKLPDGATETEAAAIANKFAMELAKDVFHVRVSNLDLQTVQTTKPNPAQPLAASMYLIDNTIIPRAQRDYDRYGSVVDLTNPQHPNFDPSLGSLDTRIREFDKAHPLSSYTPNLGGANAATPTAPASAPAAATAPAQTAAPPVPGARQAPDGNWYVSDPKRAGKYLQVMPGGTP